MVDILKQEESAPASYPAVTGLSDAALALDPDAIWQRIESYIAHRFAAREVVWTIEGVEDDALRFPLTPVASMTAEKWEAGAWVSVTLSEGPMGYVLPSDGSFRIAAQVGAGPVPAAVTAAFQRLAEYSADTEERAGATDYSVNLGGAIQENFSRYPSWLARAMQYSGAADLLRPYRRA